MAIQDVLYSFQASDGSPLALGYVTFRLNTDAVTDAEDQIIAGRVVKVSLDSSGNLPSGLVLFPNDRMTPTTVYVVKAYSALGQLVWQGEISLDTDFLLQEDSNLFVLEDGSGDILLES